MEKDIGTVYYAEVNAEGLIEYPNTEVLQIFVGDTIVFHIKLGLPIAREARLRINLPFFEEERLKYVNSQTFRTYKRLPSKISMNETLQRVLAQIEPKPSPFGGLDFEVVFKHAGSFFYQIEYYDVKLKMTS